MNKNKMLNTKKNNDGSPIPPAVGRKRDHSLDSIILEATLTALAEMGYDRMTMDQVASKAGSGKATVYRRWSSKTELVRDALVYMNRRSVELTELPDTGTLRGDLLALIKPKSSEQSEFKLKVLSGLGSFFAEYHKIAEDISAQIFGGWEKANTELMKRAIERGEISPSASIEEACRVISAMTAYTTTLELKIFDKSSYGLLLDGILLPALRAGTKSSGAKK